jgi:hypothetical protein
MNNGIRYRHLRPVDSEYEPMDYVAELEDVANEWVRRLPMIREYLLYHDATEVAGAVSAAVAALAAVGVLAASRPSGPPAHGGLDHTG